ncbi:hypothetical protein MMC22_002228 [Lobaria immixta]|nr:hypothetical protein [Lobaria immixta]
MSKPASLQIYPGKGLGFLILESSLHDVLTRIKAQPHVYPNIDVVYTPRRPLVEPVVLNLPVNGLRLRFDGPDQRLRLIEVHDFTRTQLSYKNLDLVKLPEAKSSPPAYSIPSGPTGPIFRHVYNRLMGPTFPGEYIPPTSSCKSGKGLYVLSYPGIAFTFPLQDSEWSPKIDFVSLLSSSAAAPAKSLAIFNGPSWQEARGDLFTRTCPNPRSLALSSRSKELRPDEIDLVKIHGNGKIEMMRRSSLPFIITLSETTPQDLIAELGPPDAIYRKSDRRLSIHKTHGRQRTAYHRPYSASPGKYDDLTDTDQSSTHTATDESDGEDDPITTDESHGDLSAECFYNYFHHGLDVFVSYATSPSPSFPSSSSENSLSTGAKNVDHVVATKILLHANVPGSYPFNRYRRSRWVVDSPALQHLDRSLTSETPFTELSRSLKQIWKGSYANESEERSLQRGMVLNRGWGDSPGSSCELLGGWEESADTQRKGSVNSAFNGGPGSGNTELFGFPGLVFEVLKNDVVSCLTIY